MECTPVRGHANPFGEAFRFQLRQHNQSASVYRLLHHCTEAAVAEIEQLQVGGRPVDSSSTGPGLPPSTGPSKLSLWRVVPPVLVVDPWRAATFGAQNHQRLALQPLGLEVCEQGDHRQIQDRGLTCRPLEVVAVGVPVGSLPADI